MVERQSEIARLLERVGRNSRCLMGEVGGALRMLGHEVKVGPEEGEEMTVVVLWLVI